VCPSSLDLICAYCGAALDWDLLERDERLFCHEVCWTRWRLLNRVKTKLLVLRLHAAIAKAQGS